MTRWQRAIFLWPCAASAAMLVGCAASAPSPQAATPPADPALVPSTQRVVDTCQNEVGIEFDSSWSTFRFASQSNPATLKITLPATHPAPLPTPDSQPLPTGTSDAQDNRGEAAANALRGNVSADSLRGSDWSDALRGSASADALRGSASAREARGQVEAIAARGTCTVQVLRGNAEITAARHENTSAVVRPDLTVTLKADPPAAAPGDTVIYTVTIKNISGIEARDVTMTDYLPEQMEIFSARGATITVDPDDSSTHLTLPGAIPPGKSVEVQLLARVKASAGHP